MSFRFKPEDFGSRSLDGTSGGMSIEWAAQKANVLLEAHEKTLPRVYGTKELTIWGTSEEDLEDVIQTLHTHTALLWDVKELK